MKELLYLDQRITLGLLYFTRDGKEVPVQLICYDGHAPASCVGVPIAIIKCHRTFPSHSLWVPDTCLTSSTEIYMNNSSMVLEVIEALEPGVA